MCETICVDIAILIPRGLGGWAGGAWAEELCCRRGLEGGGWKQPGITLASPDEQRTFKVARRGKGKWTSAGLAPSTGEPKERAREGFSQLVDPVGVDRFQIFIPMCPCAPAAPDGVAAYTCSSPQEITANQQYGGQ